MKRKLAFLLALVLTFCLFVTACGDSVKDESDSTSKKSTTTAQKEPETVQVPRFIGKMYYEEVENNEEYDRNFNLQIKWEEATDPACKKGEVFKQEPAAGSIVQKGASVTLYVNGVVFDPSDLELDEEGVAGHHKDTVRLWLERCGFAVYEKYENNAYQPAKHVISIDIKAGKVYPYGTRVTMLISLGA